MKNFNSFFLPFFDIIINIILYYFTNLEQYHKEIEKHNIIIIMSLSTRVEIQTEVKCTHPILIRFIIIILTEDQNEKNFQTTSSLTNQSKEYHIFL